MRSGGDQSPCSRRSSATAWTRIIQFDGLGPEIIVNVVDKFLFELESQLAEKHVSIDFSPEAREWLAQHGYDPAMGARPMSRLIQEKIKKSLAEELLFGELAEGGHVRVDVTEGELDFDIAERAVQ